MKWKTWKNYNNKRWTKEFWEMGRERDQAFHNKSIKNGQ